jgi:hypothetical protein
MSSIHTSREAPGSPSTSSGEPSSDGITSKQATPTHEDLLLKDLEGGIVGISSRDIPPGQPIFTSFKKARAQKSHIPDSV